MKKALEEIRGLDSAELHQTLAELRKEQFQLRFHAAAEQVSKTSRHKEIRRHIARIMTVLGERDRKAAAEAAGANQ